MSSKNRLIQLTGKFSLTQATLFCMVLGIVVGTSLFELSGLAPVLVHALSILRLGGELFLSSLKLLVVPLVFFSIVCGTASVGDSSRLGSVAIKSIILYVATTAIAISLGLLLAQLLGPGIGFDLNLSQEPRADGSMDLNQIKNLSYQAVDDKKSWVDAILALVPTNPVRAMFDENMIQVILFAGLLGVGILKSGEKGRSALAGFESLNAVILETVQIVIYLAPVGAFCLIAQIFAKQGLSALGPLSMYFSVVVLTLALHMFGTYMLLLKFAAKVSPFRFLRNFKSVPLIAFSTSSSGATLPVTLKNAEDNLGVDSSVASFTIPLGATLNMDGTAIMQGVATCFIAQAYQIDLSLWDLMMVVVTAVMASIGTAGVPSVGLVTLAMVLNQVGLPVEGIGLILGVDRLLDMLRTVVNVTGDSVVSVVVASSENKLNRDILENAPLELS